MGRAKAPTTDLSPATLPHDHLLTQLGPPKGSNNFQSTSVDGVERLVEISSRIRKSVLVTRGDFAFVKLFPAAEKDRPGALAGEIVHVATDREVRDWKRAGEWPSGFGERPAPPAAPAVDENANDALEQAETEDGSDPETAAQEQTS